MHLLLNLQLLILDLNLNFHKGSAIGKACIADTTKNCIIVTLTVVGLGF